MSKNYADWEEDKFQDLPDPNSDIKRYNHRNDGLARAVRTLDAGGTLTKRLDDDSGNTDIIYVASAAQGTATSAALWQIKRITLTSGAFPITIEWSDGDTAFDNVYDDRESLSYS